MVGLLTSEEIRLCNKALRMEEQMVNLNEPENDGRSPSEDYWVTGYFIIKDDTIPDELWDEQIGTVVLPRDIAHNAMPYELEINGVTYKRED